MDPFALFNIAPILTRRDTPAADSADGSPSLGSGADDGADAFAELVAGADKAPGRSAPPTASENTGTAETATALVPETGHPAEPRRGDYWRNMLAGGESEVRAIDDVSIESSDGAPEPHVAAHSAEAPPSPEAGIPGSQLQAAIQASGVAPKPQPNGAQPEISRPDSVAPLRVQDPARDHGGDIATRDPDDGLKPANHSAAPPMPPQGEGVAANLALAPGIATPSAGSPPPRATAEPRVGSADHPQAAPMSATTGPEAPRAAKVTAGASHSDPATPVPATGQAAQPKTAPRTSVAAVSTEAEFTPATEPVTSAPTAQADATPSPLATPTSSTAEVENLGRPDVAANALKPSASTASPLPTTPEATAQPTTAPRRDNLGPSPIPAALADELPDPVMMSVKIEGRRVTPATAEGVADVAAAAPQPRTVTTPHDLDAALLEDATDLPTPPPATAEKNPAVATGAGDPTDRRPAESAAMAAQPLRNRTDGARPETSAAAPTQKVAIDTVAPGNTAPQAVSAPAVPHDASPSAATPNVTPDMLPQSGAMPAPASPKAVPEVASAAESAFAPEIRATNRRERRLDRIDEPRPAGADTVDKTTQGAVGTEASTQRPNQPAAGLAPASVMATAPDPIASTGFTTPQGVAQVGDTARDPIQTATTPSTTPPPPTAQIATAIASEGPRASQIDVTLSPEELGHVRLRLHHSEAGLSVTVSADRPETLDLLRRNIDTLARDFQDIGYGDVSFSFGDQPRQERQAPPPQDGFLRATPDFLTERGPDPTASPLPQSRLPDGGLDLRI